MTDFRSNAERPVSTTGVKPMRAYELFEAEKDGAQRNTNITAEEFGRLIAYRLTFDRALNRAGLCSYAQRTVSLSRHYLTRTDEAHLIGTIRHELAHAAVGPGKGHGPVWKDAARRMGCSDARCYEDGELAPRAIPALYIGTTQGACECSFEAHRLGKRMVRGVKCRKHGNHVFWQQNR